MDPYYANIRAGNQAFPTFVTVNNYYGPWVAQQQRRYYPVPRRIAYERYPSFAPRVFNAGFAPHEIYPGPARVTADPGFAAYHQAWQQSPLNFEYSQTNRIIGNYNGPYMASQQPQYLPVSAYQTYTRSSCTISSYTICTGSIPYTEHPNFVSYPQAWQEPPVDHSHLAPTSHAAQAPPATPLPQQPNNSTRIATRTLVVADEARPPNNESWTSNVPIEGFLRTSKRPAGDVEDTGPRKRVCQDGTDHARTPLKTGVVERTAMPAAGVTQPNQKTKSSQNEIGTEIPLESSSKTTDSWLVDEVRALRNPRAPGFKRTPMSPSPSLRHQKPKDATTFSNDDGTISLSESDSDALVPRFTELRRSDRKSRRILRPKYVSTLDNVPSSDDERSTDSDGSEVLGGKSVP